MRRQAESFGPRRASKSGRIVRTNMGPRFGRNQDVYTGRSGSSVGACAITALTESATLLARAVSSGRLAMPAAGGQCQDNCTDERGENDSVICRVQRGAWTSSGRQRADTEKDPGDRGQKCNECGTIANLAANTRRLQPPGSHRTGPPRPLPAECAVHRGRTPARPDAGPHPRRM